MNRSKQSLKGGPAALAVFEFFCYKFGMKQVNVGGRAADHARA